MVCKQKVRYTENEKNCMEASILAKPKTKPRVRSTVSRWTSPTRWDHPRNLEKDWGMRWYAWWEGRFNKIHTARDAGVPWVPFAILMSIAVGYLKHFAYFAQMCKCVHSFSSTWWIIGNLRQFDSDSWIITCVLRIDGLVWGYKISLPMVHNVGSSHKDMHWKRYLIL